jgi:erythromycin esterase
MRIRPVLSYRCGGSAAWVSLVALGVLCGLAPAWGQPAPAAADDARVAWLQRHATTLRTLDPNDDDFADLEPFRRAVGSSRIVMLGEQTHGDGATFHAKTRLIRFLHERCGFDVLAFESGLYDCRKAWELLGQGKIPPDKAVAQGVFAIWTESEQVRPLVQYLGKQAKTAHPLELAGLDCQFTAEASSTTLVDDLTAFIKRLPKDGPPEGDWAVVVEACRTLARPPAKLDERQIASFAACRRVLDAMPAPEGIPASEFAFWKQFLESAGAYAAAQRFLGTDAMDDHRQYTNVRDPQMARNLVWLARTAYPGRKIIVWAASMHIARNPATMKMIVKKDGRPVEPRQAIGQHDDTRTLGDEAWKVLGEEMYTVAFTAAEGEFKLPWWDTPRKLDAVVPGSLEDLMARAGFTYAFVDLRHRGDDGRWLSERLAARPLGHADSEADWARVFDALVFTRKMTGSDRVKRPSRLVAHRADDPAVRAELDRFQGEWVMAANESNGTPLSAERLKLYRRVVKGDVYTTTLANDAGTTVIRGRFAIKPQTDPREIDVEPENGELMQGIYKLEGERFTICFAPPGLPRPTSFAAGEGTRATITVWQRPPRPDGT